MDVKPAPGTSGPVFTPVIDLSQVSLLELLHSRQPAVNSSLQQVIRSLDDPNGVISAFQSFASGR